MWFLKGSVTSKESHQIFITLCCYSKTGSCDEVAVLCMEVLANMCRCSVSVRAHIKGQVCVKWLRMLGDTYILYESF